MGAEFHLASALMVQDVLEEPVAFMSADKRLNAAASKEKLEVLSATR